jgi:methanogenic corrinoid protein MtbC1
MLQQDFLAALRIGDETGAQQVIAQARADDLDARTIYLEILAPSMITIGNLWERNELSVAEEHLATAITERVINQLSPTFGRKDIVKHGGSILLGCIEGERHALGLRMVADLFRQQGWNVFYLGADVPTSDWIRLAVRYQVAAVAISAAEHRRARAIKHAIEEFRAALPDILVLVGGAAFHADPELWRTVGATFYNADPVAAVTMLTAHYALLQSKHHQGTPITP